MCSALPFVSGHLKSEANTLKRYVCNNNYWCIMIHKSLTMMKEAVGWRDMTIANELLPTGSEHSTQLSLQSYECCRL